MPRDSPAGRAGLEGTERDLETGDLLLGDIIVALDHRPVRTYTDLLNILDKKRVGDLVRVRVLGAWCMVRGGIMHRVCGGVRGRVGGRCHLPSPALTCSHPPAPPLPGPASNPGPLTTLLALCPTVF